MSGPSVWGKIHELAFEAQDCCDAMLSTSVGSEDDIIHFADELAALSVKIKLVVEEAFLWPRTKDLP